MGWNSAPSADNKSLIKNQKHNKMKKVEKSSSAGINDESSTNVQDSQVSQPIAKPSVSRIQVGDFITGSWRDKATGKTFFTDGYVKKYPAGLFVENDGGITPLESFFHFTEIRQCERIKVYELDFGDTNLLDKDPKTLADWIKTDIDDMKESDELNYTITIRMISQEEFNTLPEWS